MENQFHADTLGGEDTSAGAAPENKTDHGTDASRDSGDTGNGDKIMVPKYRLDEYGEKIESLKQELEKYKASSAQSSDIQQKLAQVFGGQGNPEDSDLKSLVEDYKIPQEVVDRLVGVAEKKLQGSLEERLRPLQNSTAEMHFRSEVADLRSKFPAIREWDNEKMAELRKIYAGEERYRGLSLEEIVRLRFPEATQQTGSSYTAEVTSGRTAQAKGEKPVSEMDEEEFNKYLASKGAKKSVR